MIIPNVLASGTWGITISTPGMMTIPKVPAQSTPGIMRSTAGKMKIPHVLVRVYGGFAKKPPGKEVFILSYMDQNYFCCSNCRVIVVRSQTSVGPQYWIGPGYR